MIAPAIAPGPLRVAYEPAPLVRTFVEDTTFLTGYFGPLGCGKTTAGAIKGWIYGQGWPGARIAGIRVAGGVVTRLYCRSCRRQEAVRRCHCLPEWLCRRLRQRCDRARACPSVHP